MIADSRVLPLNSLCCSISCIVNCGSISKDFPYDVSILTAAFISLLVVAVVISIISMSRLVFTLTEDYIISYKKCLFQLKNLIIQNLTKMSDYFLLYSRQVITRTCKDPASSTTPAKKSKKSEKVFRKMILFIFQVLLLKT